MQAGSSKTPDKHHSLYEVPFKQLQSNDIQNNTEAYAQDVVLLRPVVHDGEGDGVDGGQHAAGHQDPQAVTVPPAPSVAEAPSNSAWGKPPSTHTGMGFPPASLTVHSTLVSPSTQTTPQHRQLQIWRKINGANPPFSLSVNRHMG